MFHGGFHTMIRTSILTAGLLGTALLLTGCVTPYVSGTVGTRIGNGGYVSGTVGGYPYGYGGYGNYGGYDRYGYGRATVYGYDRYGNPIYRMPDGRLVTGRNYNSYDRYYGYPGGGYGYPGYGYPGYGYPSYGYPGYRVTPPRYSYPSRPHYPRPSTGQNEGGGVPPAAQPPRRSTGGSSSGDILRQARQVRESKPIEP